MKKEYENLELKIQLLANQDVITESVYIEWDTDWKGDDAQGDVGEFGNIFG